MKNIRWIITLLLAVCWYAAVGQTKGSIMEAAYGKIRKKMVTDACKILEYNNNNVIDLLTDKTIDTFYNALTADINKSNNAKYLHAIIGDANYGVGSLSGDQLSIYNERIKKFRTNLKYAYNDGQKGKRLSSLFNDENYVSRKEKDVEDNNEEYIGLIEELYQECDCYNKCEADGDFNNYKTNYPNGIFLCLIDIPELEQSEQAKSKVPSDKTKENKKEKSDSNEVGNSAENNNEKEFEEDLKNCKDDYESVLEKWESIPEYRDRVYEQFWKYCEGREEKDKYERYKDAVDKYGGILHFKEAKQKIEELSGDKGKDNVNDNDNDNDNVIWYIIAAVGIVLLIVVILVSRKKPEKQQTNATSVPAPAPTSKPTPTPAPKSDTPAPSSGASASTSGMSAPAPTLKPTPTPAPKSDTIASSSGASTSGMSAPVPIPKPTPVPPSPVDTSTPGEWSVVGASVKGNGHVQSGMPCQDNNKFELLGKGWGVAIVSDGAGSADHSELGSKVVVERGVFHFKNLIEKEGWMDNNVLPSDVEWLQKSYSVLKNIRNEVEMIAKKNNVELKSLSATCLVVIFSPEGLLAVHVGDGRMGCRTAAGGWKAIMTPHKGEEANQTLFLVSDFWSIPNYVQSGVLVPESVVIREPVEAFALMSDGCEATAWLCTTQNPETGKYYDQNKPFEKFFNPLEETLISFHNDKVAVEERNEKWSKFIESGTKGFVKEQDDKTMILGVYCRE